MLSIDQTLEENTQINQIRCTAAVYSKYRLIETKQGKAIIGYPADGARITRDQLLDCDEVKEIRECITDPYELHHCENLIVEKRFSEWASKNGQVYKNIDEKQPHTLLRLMRLVESNRNQSTDIQNLLEGLLFKKLSHQDADVLSKNALKYCEKYGFPRGEIVECDSGNLYYGCTLDELYFFAPNGLNHTYNRYMAWRYLQLKDIEAKEHCLMLGGKAPTNDRDYKRIIVGWWPTSIHVQPVYRDDTPELLNICESQIDMAAVQLTQIIALGDQYMGNRHILYCKGCNNPFISTHRSQKFCADCRLSSTARVRIKRLKDQRNKSEDSGDASEN